MEGVWGSIPHSSTNNAWEVLGAPGVHESVFGRTTRCRVGEGGTLLEVRHIGGWVAMG